MASILKTSEINLLNFCFLVIFLVSCGVPTVRIGTDGTTESTQVEADGSDSLGLVGGKTKLPYTVLLPGGWPSCKPGAQIPKNTRNKSGNIVPLQWAALRTPRYTRILAQSTGNCWVRNDLPPNVACKAGGNEWIQILCSLSEWEHQTNVFNSDNLTRIAKMASEIDGEKY